MNQPIAPNSGYRSRLRANILSLFLWNAAWLAATALMAFGPKFLWNKSPAVTMLAVTLDLAVGVGMVLATKRYVMELDELQQKVYLNALAITVGVGLIVAMPYSVLDLYHVIPFKAEIAHMWALMGLTFAASCVYGSWRYR